VQAANGGYIGAPTEHSQRVHRLANLAQLHSRLHRWMLSDGAWHQNIVG